MKSKLTLYYNDLFHTMVNVRPIMPSYMFLFFFFGSYIVMYLAFAYVYLLEPAGCISKVNHFLHALWFSVHTSATIGYGHMAPNPDCPSTNLMILLQVLTTNLLQAALLGCVYARFSEHMTCHSRPDGSQWLCIRVGNMRRHQLLHPEVRMVLMRLIQTGPEKHEYVYSDLSVAQVRQMEKQLGN
ncbi:hypothetical protein QBZ16_002812 [Prototheca wickerhamii]|uniref:Potassium channel inwardly rectifying transmembrane domain-containing protein n=1 Tax=Prototheca wickerhamii TaxID=3111 RepID=A0AAD9IK31_PROWI|nr:hypothetical protein QBZ16_002812 [Prototheca wickerhamii]